MATALLEMAPESFKLNAQLAPALIMPGIARCICWNIR